MIPSSRLQAARIMVIDDQAANVRVLERFLGLGGFREVRACTDPRLALTELERERPDLVLLDLLMPEVDGYMILERIRALDTPETRTPVVVLTADVTRDSRDRALGLGATDFLTKPFDPTEISLRIRNILETRFLQLDLIAGKASLEEQVRERTSELRASLDRLRALSEQRERLVRRLVTAQEEERRRIAADIHDDTIQTVVALGIRLELTRRKATEPAVREELDRAIETVRTATHGLRELLFALHPAVLDRDGLQAALRAELDRARDAEPAMTFEIVGELGEEPSLQPRTTIFRIAQEALANARRHAHAAHVRVELGDVEGGIRLRVIDDGRGMDPALARRPRHGHLGLVSMRERAELAGGTWQLDTAPGQGTTVEVWIPVEPAALGADFMDEEPATHETDVARSDAPGGRPESKQ